MLRHCIIKMQAGIFAEMLDQIFKRQAYRRWNALFSTCAAVPSLVCALCFDDMMSKWPSTLSVVPAGTFFVRVMADIHSRKWLLKKKNGYLVHCTYFKLRFGMSYNNFLNIIKMQKKNKINAWFVRSSTLTKYLCLLTCSWNIEKKLSSDSSKGEHAVISFWTVLPIHKKRTWKTFFKL